MKICAGFNGIQSLVKQSYRENLISYHFQQFRKSAVIRAFQYPCAISPDLLQSILTLDLVFVSHIISIRFSIQSRIIKMAFTFLFHRVSFKPVHRLT